MLEHQNQEALSKIDLSTLQAATAVCSAVGFQHFGLSKDTRLPLEARKAHRFVALNCETICRKILHLASLPADQVEAILHEISRQTIEFNKQRQSQASMQPVSESIKQ